MCTVSWLHANDSYHLLCNRDERTSRKPAQSPQVFAAPTADYISPRDPEGGGTWIAANALGVSIALLNGPAVPKLARASRGTLPDQLIRLGTPARIKTRLHTIDFSDFAPFTLLLLAPGEPGNIYKWDGSQIRHQTGDTQHGLLTSSSYDDAGARSYRNTLFQTISQDKPITPELLEALHTCHGESPSAYTPCMHRADAETVSYSRIEVTPNSIQFHYKPTAPCRPGSPETFQIQRTR